MLWCSLLSTNKQFLDYNQISIWFIDDWVMKYVWYIKEKKPKQAQRTYKIIFQKAASFGKLTLPSIHHIIQGTETTEVRDSFFSLSVPIRRKIKYRRGTISSIKRKYPLMFEF